MNVVIVILVVVTLIRKHNLDLGTHSVYLYLPVVPMGMSYTYRKARPSRTWWMFQIWSRSTLAGVIDVLTWDKNSECRHKYKYVRRGFGPPDGRVLLVLAGGPHGHVIYLRVGQAIPNLDEVSDLVQVDRVRSYSCVNVGQK